LGIKDIKVAVATIGDACHRVPASREKRPMKSNRHVPLIIGLLCIALALWLVLSFSGWWVTSSLAVLPLWFGWASLKTAFRATDREVDELTGVSPMSDDTAQRFKDRL
jgi:hypothetical protein